jgi:pheromone shutdown-related protein TraB
VNLPSSVTEIVHEGTTYYIIGTAHVSQRSIDDVRQVIDEVKPDVVCVELDQVRYEALTKDSAFRDLDVFKVVREGRTLYLLAHLALSSYQRRIGAELGVKPGAELLAAAQEATARSIPVALIDRDINITLKRTWKNLGLWKRSLLLSSLIVGFEDEDDEDEEDDDGEKKAPKSTANVVEDLKEPKALSEMLTELGKQVPQIKGPLIDERDRYLASKAIEAGAGKRAVVAVVGAAHVPGMKEHWGKPVDRAALELIPPAGLLWRVIKWAIPVLFLVGLIYFWQQSEERSLVDMMARWILPTSIGAGLLTALAGGSIFSIATAIVVSPVAAIHPLLGTGMVVGVVEAWRRRPNVVDCEQLPEDIQTWRGFWRNRVTRILLIAVASGIGTAVGFWIGVTHVVTS